MDLSLKHRLLSALLALLLAAAMGGCSFLEELGLPFQKDGEQPSSAEEISSAPEEEDPEYPVTIAGAALKSRPGKVVALTPSLTEKIYDLKMQDALAGVSEYCDYPEAVGALPACGTMLLPDLELIREIGPHLLLTEAPLSEEDTVALLQMDVEIAVLPHAGSLAELYDVYETIAVLLEGRTTGATIGKAFTGAFREKLDTLAELSANGEEEAVPVLYLRLLDFTVATGDTLEGELLEAAGLRNIAADYTDWHYPEASAQSESGRADFMAVRAIFCDEREVTIKMLEQSAFYKGLPAVLQDWYLYIDAAIFERQGLRMLDLLREIAEYCYDDQVISG